MKEEDLFDEPCDIIVGYLMADKFPSLDDLIRLSISSPVHWLAGGDQGWRTVHWIATSIDERSPGRLLLPAPQLSRE